MGEDHVDFSPIDPTADGARFDRIVDSIVQQAAEELAARRARPNLLIQLVRWKRPMLAAAAVAAILSIAVLWRLESTDYTLETTGVAEAIGVPSLLAQGIRENNMPTPVELFAAFQELP